MLTSLQIRNLLNNYPKYPDCKFVNRDPIINPAFLGTFNLSFAEKQMLNEFGKYQNFDHDFIFSTIQTVIRPNDIFEDLPRNPWKYLGVFEMADIYGCICLKNKDDIKNIQIKQARHTINLLNQLGISNKQIYPKYCAGGHIIDITKGKYKFDFRVPEDKITKLALLEAGIPNKNLVPDKTRDTFLALFLHRPIAWGYRTEIEVDVGVNTKQLLDTATLEYFLWDPVFQGEIVSKNIIGLKNIAYTLSLSVVGLERLYMASQKIPDVRQIDYLKKFYNIIKQKNPQNMLAGELLRALHFIYSYTVKFTLDIRKNRKYMLNRMARNIPYDLGLIKKLLEINTINQPWHKHLKAGIEPAIEFIKNYRSRTTHK